MPVNRTWPLPSSVSPWPSSPLTWDTADHVREAFLLSAPASILIALDYGTRKFGVAVGQTITGTASAQPVIRASNGEPDWEALDALVEQWKPVAFVVGMPYNMDGTDSDMTTKVQAFVGALAARYDRPCHTMDERLSSREARELSRANAEAGGRKFNHRLEVDSFAAQLILESWLSEHG
jgi:putative Holliday junction resolvase